MSHILNQLKLFPKDKWEDFGLKAGLYAPTLSAIEGDCDKRFSRCLSLWLERADNVNGKGKPTWRRLAEILEEMGNKALADTITEKGQNNNVFYIILVKLVIWISVRMGVAWDMVS